MEEKFKYYRIVIEFLEKTFGNLVEMTLYDLENQKNGILLAKSSNCNLEIGSPIPKLLEKILIKYKDDKEELEFITNFPGKDSNGNLVRVSTFFLKNKKGKVAGAFNIKMDISEMVGAANFLNKMLKEITGGEERNLSEEFEEVEKLDNIEEYSMYVIAEYFVGLKKPIDALTIEEKIEIVQYLNKKGIFQVRGCISEIARRFKTSEKTIYRYLKKEKN